MITALGWTGSALLLASMTQSSQHRFRLLNLAASIILVVVNVAVGLIPMVVLNAAVAVINIRSLVRLAKRPVHAASTSVQSAGSTIVSVRRTCP